MELLKIILGVLGFLGAFVLIPMVISFAIYKFRKQTPVEAAAEEAASDRELRDMFPAWVTFAYIGAVVFLGYKFHWSSDLMKSLAFVPGLVLMKKILFLPVRAYIFLALAACLAFSLVISIALRWPDQSDPYRAYIFIISLWVVYQGFIRIFPIKSTNLSPKRSEPAS